MKEQKETDSSSSLTHKPQ